MSLTLTSSSIVSMCSSSTLTSSLIVNLSLNSSLTLTSTLIVNPSLTSSLTSSSMVSMSLNSSLTLASRLIMSSSLTLTSSLVMSMSSISTFTSSLMSMSLTWILTLTSSSMPRDRYFCVKGASECAVVLAVLQPSGLHIGNPFNAGVFYMWGGGNWRSFLAKRGAEQMMLVKRSLGTADVEEASLYALNLPYFIVHLKRLGRKSMAWKTEKREKRRRGPVTIKSTWPIANRQRPEAKMQIRSSSTSRNLFMRFASDGVRLFLFLVSCQNKYREFIPIWSIAWTLCTEETAETLEEEVSRSNDILTVPADRGTSTKDHLFRIPGSHSPGCIKDRTTTSRASM
ncbi:unnamed protein product, partial [Nesidiocoris tenuis]